MRNVETRGEMPERGQKSADLSSGCLGGFVYSFFRNVTGLARGERGEGIPRERCVHVAAALSLSLSLSAARLFTHTRVQASAEATSFRSAPTRFSLASRVLSEKSGIAGSEGGETKAVEDDDEGEEREGKNVCVCKEREGEREGDERRLGTAEAPARRAHFFGDSKKERRQYGMGGERQIEGGGRWKKGWAVMKRLKVGRAGFARREGAFPSLFRSVSFFSLFVSLSLVLSACRLLSRRN